MNRLVSKTTTAKITTIVCKVKLHFVMRQVTKSVIFMKMLVLSPKTVLETEKLL